VNSATRLGHPRTGCVPAGLWAPRGAAADLAPDLPGPPRPMFRHVGHLPTGTPPGQHGRGPARRRARRSPEPVDGHAWALASGRARHAAGPVADLAASARPLPPCRDELPNYQKW